MDPTGQAGIGKGTENGSVLHGFRPIKQQLWGETGRAGPDTRGEETPGGYDTGIQILHRQG
jgi:hypothetical protein